jgi:VTC domain
MERAIEKQLQDTLKVFAPISLQQLNASVSFLERIDTKYLVHVKDLAKIVKELEKDYFVLNIKDIRLFNYDNVYMDSKALDFYYAHERGDNIRVKVRTRNYVDSNLCFFEYKHKEGNLIRKFRYQEDTKLFGTMDVEAQHFFSSVYGSLMEGATKIDIEPIMKTTYKRFTLCSRYGDERITIDLDLSFTNPNDPNSKVVELPHLAIIESKASSVSSRSAKIMKKFDVKQAGGCSKYCLGLIYFDMVTSKKKFKNTLKYIEKTGGSVSHQKVQKKLKSVVAKSKLSMVDLKKSISDTTKARKSKTPSTKTHTIGTK